MRCAALLLAVLAAAAGACSGAGSGYRLHGVVRDAATGMPVSRATVYLHFICDESGFHVTVDPGKEADYGTVYLPAPRVRVRAFDQTKTYALFETTITVPEEGMAFDIPLSRSGRVRLFGRVVDAATGAPILPGAGGGHGPLLYFGDEGHTWTEGPIALAPDGTYSIRVPRGKVVVSVVDTAMKPVAPEIDLSNGTADEHAADIALR